MRKTVLNNVADTVSSTQSSRTNKFLVFCTGGSVNVLHESAVITSLISGGKTEITLGSGEEYTITATAASTTAIVKYLRGS